MKAVDAHCHIDFDRFDGDREEVIRRSREDLEFVVNAGSSLEHNRRTLELNREHPNFILPALGLHPTRLESFGQIEQIKEQVKEEDPVAVGEIGLDHYHVRDTGKRKRQEEVFREMLELADKLGKPVVVHSRDAEERAVEILESFSLPEVMLHCFNGDQELASRAVEQGMYIGITTQVLYSGRVEEVAEEIPLDRMLLETDSPFLYRGERNEPCNVLESAARIAEIKDKTPDRVIEETASSATELFDR